MFQLDQNAPLESYNTILRQGINPALSAGNDFEDNEHDTFLSDFVDMFVPRAEAALAAGCVSVCAAPPWGQCVACVAAALGTGAYLTVQLNKALRECNKKRWKWARRACKAVTILSYSVLIA